jgi:hypothetical protein
MKISRCQFACLSFALLPATGYSQYSYARLATFALVESYTVPALPEKDSSGRVIPRVDPVFENTFTITTTTTRTTTVEVGAKPELFRISNKEMLEALREERVVTDITGYSITEIFTDNSSSEGNDTARFYLTKRGQNPIDVSDYMSISGAQSGASSSSASSRTVATTRLATDTQVSTTTATYTDKYLSSFALNFSFGVYFTQGMNTLTRTYRVFGTGSSRYESYVPGSGRMTGVVGDGIFTDDEDPTLLEGTISFAGGVPTVLPLSSEN